ncbi:predicted protein [Sclerotinia sclerotiorum 1980 UF-70]|uniref:Uncharacterized protein n=1 Tax=Sclerotinia sclerotiorum (strain ATCC 18683 / 1980 / Ss-1) TaxID=665079 RepID=A7EPL5_SCLS1|nr:predicted protein [Sclerotinia sclerotiorum 1980 UF-70]EDO04781.1 predicted protein [Sclerotinia sclerotiorum 1980 UF-70]
MDPAAEKAFESLIQDQESVEVIFGKAKEMIWNDFAKGAGEAMMFKLLEPFAGLGELENCIKILLGMLNEEAAVLRNTGQTNTLQSLAVEIRRDICIIPKGVETNDNFVVVEFVKREKRIRVIFDLTRVNDLFFDLNVHTEAIVVLEEYVASFYRELDTTTKRHVRAQHGRFELRYNSMPREVRLEQCRIAYKMGMLLVFENIFAQQLAEEEAGIDVPEDIEDESFIDEEEIYGMDIQNNADGVSEDDLVDMENPNIEMAGWISLPFFNEDDCFSSIYQMDDNQFHLPSTHTAAVGTDEASETNYFEALFRDDESLSSQYEDDEDDDDDDDDDEEEIAESTQAHINSDDSILHVDVWLEESQSSLSHAFPWLADLQD